MDPRLLDAARGGNVDELKRLIEVNCFILDRGLGTVYHQTVLHIAASVGQTDFVKKIVELKADFATRLDKDGFGAIHIASANGFVETLKELLESNGQLARLKSSDGRTPLHCAVVTGRIPVIVELLGRFQNCIGDVTYKGETAFHLAVKYNQFEAFKTMVDLSKELNTKEILNAGDEDGNTVLHLAVARRQTQTARLLLGGDVCPQELVDVNLTNKSGLTALDVSDVIQLTVSEPADFMVRDLLLRAGASRASEDEDANSSQVYNRQIWATPRPPQTLLRFLLNEISLLNPWRYWKMLAKDVKKSPSQTQNALLVVAVLIASTTYQGILSPPDGIDDGSCDQNGCDHKKYDRAAYISHDFLEFLPFMVPNSLGFFASLAVIILVMDNFPLGALLVIAVRCMAASYLFGLFVVGPRSLRASPWPTTIVVAIVLLDLLFHFGRWLRKRCSKAIWNSSI